MTGKTESPRQPRPKQGSKPSRSSTRSSYPREQTCARGDDSESVSPHQIRVLRMLAQVVHHETAAGDDLQSIGADQLQRALYQLRGDAAAAQRARRLGAGDDGCAWRKAVIRKRHRALDAEFEAASGLVVADLGPCQAHFSRSAYSGCFSMSA